MGTAVFAQINAIFKDRFPTTSIVEGLLPPFQTLCCTYSSSYPLLVSCPYLFASRTPAFVGCPKPVVTCLFGSSLDLVSLSKAVSRLLGADTSTLHGGSGI